MGGPGSGRYPKGSGGGRKSKGGYKLIGKPRGHSIKWLIKKYGRK